MTMDTPTFTYASNATIPQLAQRVREASCIALATHGKPDGDALGSMVALYRGLETLGKRTVALVMGPLEPNLASLAGEVPLRDVERDPPRDDEPFDLVIVVDTGSWSQLEPLGPWLRARYERVIGLDHHAEGDDVASQRVVDPSCAATTQVVLEVLDELGVDLNTGEGPRLLNSIAEALFLGLATDTGWFRHANADAKAFAAATRLLECGVDKDRLYQIVEDSWRPQRLHLQRALLESMSYHRDGTVAVMSLSPADFAEADATVDDMIGLVNTPLCVSQVRAAVLLTQTQGGVTKVSFRSKPPITGEPGEFIDVNAMARQLGGGGHVHAAGARLNLDLPNAREAVIGLVERYDARS